MNKKFLQILRCPLTSEQLRVHLLSDQNNTVDEYFSALLISDKSNIAYPVIDAVPRMIRGALSLYSKELTKWNKEISKLNVSEKSYQIDEIYRKLYLPTLTSFQTEWKHHSISERTWGLSQPERLNSYLKYMQIPLDDYSFKLFLDAGAGTGQLTCTIAEKMNCNIVGVDLTLGIIKGEYLRRSLKNKDNILFVQANIMELPFEKRVFDYIHSSGVIHHTPDTYKAFCSIEEYTKPGGKLGVWIYRKAETKIPLIPFVKNPQLQLIESKTRKITTKMNRRLLYVLIYIYSSIFHFSYKMNELLRGKKHNQTIKERTTSLFDALAPPYAHKHEPSELVSWFKEKGYKDLTETDQENTAGFNICAIKI